MLAHFIMHPKFQTYYFILNEKIINAILLTNFLSQLMA